MFRAASLLAIACACVYARAETQAQAVVRLSWVISHGQFESAITEADAVIRKWPSPDPGLLYMRGYARYRLALFDEAEPDLRRVGAYRLPFAGNWPAAEDLVAKIARIRAARPPIASEVRLGGKVAFRTYVDTDDAWSRALVALLPEARRIGKEFLGTERDEVSVLVFPTRRRLDDLVSVYIENRPLQSWVWALSANGMLAFCRVNARGESPGADPKSPLFRELVVHEYAHLLLFRQLGNLRIPRWFDEGVAQLAGSRAAPERVEVNDRALRRIFAESALMPLAELEGDGFDASVETSSATPGR